MNTFRLYIALLLSVITFSGCSNDDDPAVDNGVQNAQITITEYQWKFGEVSTIGDLYEQYTYDSKDNLIKKETNHYYNSTIGRIPNYYTFKYDEQNHLIERSDYSFYTLDNKYKYTFNSIDSIATMEEYTKEGTLSESWIYTYDSQRRLIQAKQTYDLIIPYVDDYSYNGNDVTVVRHRVDTGELFGTTMFEYDDHRNLLKKTWTNGKTGKQDLEVYNEYSYNSQGKISKATIHGYYNKNDLTYKEYTYNSDGTIQRIHVSYSFKTDQSNLDYTYSKI